MAKDDQPEVAVMAEFRGEFEFNGPSARKLLNGNKIHIVLECDYSVDAMAKLAALMAKDVKVHFKELASKKTRKRVGEEDSKNLFGGGVEPGSEE